MAAPVALTELRLEHMSTVTVSGERRSDIAWSLVVEATGQSEQTAQQSAANTVLRPDDLGEVLSLSIQAAPESHQTSTLTLRVPSWLAVRIESARRSTVTGVASVRLENLVGDVTLRDVAGSVGGGHRNGELTVQDVGDLAVTLASSKCTITGVRGTATINARNGQCRIVNPLGAVTIEANAQTMVIEAPAAAVRISSLGGETTIERPEMEVHVDGRRTRTAVSLDRAVPLTLFTTDATATLTLAAGLPITLDVAVTDGDIDATAIGLTPETLDQNARLVHAYGGGARVAIRNQRGNVVIAPRK